MKPDWDKLMKNWNKGKRAATTLIADVDCTAAGKDLCETHGVRGFPTIKWGDVSALEDYDGGRDYDALKTWAKANLKPICSPSNLDLCDEEKKKEITALSALPAEELATKIEASQKEIKDAEEAFESGVKELQATYEGLEKSKTETIAKVKAAGLGLMQAVQANKKSKASEAPKEEL